MSMASGPVVIFRTHSDIEASIVRGLLEAHGIPVLISSGLTRSVFPVSVSGAGELRVAVSEMDASEAQRLIESHREEMTGGRVVPLRDEFRGLEDRIGYRFRDPGLLEHALTHRSRVHEDATGGVFDNESLEFLGDAVLGFVIADLLFREFPQHNEGEKSKIKASIVSAPSLARLAEQIGLGDFSSSAAGKRRPAAGARRRSSPTATRRSSPPSTWTAACRRRARSSSASSAGSSRTRRSAAPRRRSRGLQVRAPGMAAVARSRPAGVPPRRRAGPGSPPDVRGGSARRRRDDRARRGTQQERGGADRREARRWTRSTQIP